MGGDAAGDKAFSNLFIGIVMTSMAAAQKESEVEQRAKEAKLSASKALAAQITSLQQRLDLFKEDVEAIQMFIVKDHEEQERAIRKKIEEEKSD